MTENINCRPLAVLFMLAALGSLPLAQAQSSAAKMPAMSASADAMAHGAEAMNRSMMRGMKQMQDMKPGGNTDKDFAMMMKMHHEQALDMARVEIEHGKSPEMKSMAKRIIVAQKKEIAEFERWMKAHP